MTVEEQKFKLFLSPEDFFNRVEASSQLRKIVRDTEGIIALKDLSKMVDAHEATMNAPIGISIEDLQSLIRSIPDSKGKKVYSEAMIQTGKMSHSLIRNYQTFVQGDKLLSIYKLNRLLSRYDFSGIATSATSAITCEGKHGRYVAFYLPPIVEYLPKETLRAPLENLIRRAKKEKSINLPSFDGNGTVNLNDVIRKNQEMLTSQLQAVHVLRDGTHRAYITNLPGVALHMIEINGSMAEPPSVLIKTNDIVITSKKPKRMEDRFLGLRTESDGHNKTTIGWLNLKHVGIDG